MLNEMQDKVMDNIMAHVVVDTNLFKAEGLIFKAFIPTPSFVFRGKFKLNNQEFMFEKTFEEQELRPYQSKGSQAVAQFINDKVTEAISQHCVFVCTENTKGEVLHKLFIGE